MIKTGQILNNTYEVRESIGSGSGGIIFKAYHLRMKKAVAIKLVKNEVKGKVDIRTEVDVLKNLKNDYLPTVIDFVEDGEDIYTVMEFIEGKNFKQLIESGKTFPEKSVRKYAKQLCRAVSYLHNQKPPIIHSDIKPENIMLTPEDDICLIDFNISMISSNGISEAIGGSRGFAAPEQFKRIISAPAQVGSFQEQTRFVDNDETEIILDDEPPKNPTAKTKNAARAFVDVRSDIYGIGASLFYILTGRIPYNGKTDFRGIRVSGILKKIIKKAMNPAADKRFRNVPALENALKKKGHKKRVIGILSACVAAGIIAVCCIPGVFSDISVSVNNMISDIISGENGNTGSIVIKGVRYSTSLTELDLNYKGLTNKDIKKLSKMTNLKKLHLGDNDISDISPLSKLTNLTELNLFNNQITDISPLKNCTNLTVLSLWGNKISNITILKELKNLEELSLRDNQIKSIGALRTLKNLHMLNISENQISNISVLANFGNLNKLYMFNNNISDISSLSKLENLTDIDISNNQVDAVTPLYEMKNLKHIELYNNPLSSLDIDNLRNELPDCKIEYSLRFNTKGK